MFFFFSLSPTDRESWRLFGACRAGLVLRGSRHINTPLRLPLLKYNSAKRERGNKEFDAKGILIGSLEAMERYISSLTSRGLGKPKRRNEAVSKINLCGHGTGT